jgi:hypothetical protein
VPAPFADLTYTRAHARRRPWAGKRLLLALVALVLVGALGYGGYRGVQYIRHQNALKGTPASHSLDQTQLKDLQQVTPGVSDRALILGSRPSVDAPPSPIPSGAILKAPYTVQAPFGNWKFHQESCEEAALLMYHDFLGGDTRTDIPAAEADRDLRAMKAWQVQNWGSEVDLSIDRTGQLAQAYYHYQYKVIDITETSIKQAIADGHPVIVPVMTHSLQNPHYGPMTVYHEVFIKGYTDKGVVTNDAGVQEGKDWFYSWSVLMGAIDAQTPKMHQGRVGLILSQ